MKIRDYSLKTNMQLYFRILANILYCIIFFGYVVVHLKMRIAPLERCWLIRINFFYKLILFPGSRRVRSPSRVLLYVQYLPGCRDSNPSCCDSVTTASCATNELQTSLKLVCVCSLRLAEPFSCCLPSAPSSLTRRTRESSLISQQD